MSERDTADAGARGDMRNESGPILRDDVGEFCEDFTELYQGWLVAVVSQGQDGQWRVIADQQPLQALSYQASDGHFDIRIVLGTNDGELFAHVVSDVRTVDLHINGNGTADELTLGSADGVTAVRVRSPGVDTTGRAVDARSG